MIVIREIGAEKQKLIRNRNTWRDVKDIRLGVYRVDSCASLTGR